MRFRRRVTRKLVRQFAHQREGQSIHNSNERSRLQRRIESVRTADDANRRLFSALIRLVACFSQQTHTLVTVADSLFCQTTNSAPFLELELTIRACGEFT